MIVSRKKNDDDCKPAGKMAALEQLERAAAGSGRYKSRISKSNKKGIALGDAWMGLDTP
jgi:hypothetical protein